MLLGKSKWATKRTLDLLNAHAKRNRSQLQFEHCLVGNLAERVRVVQFPFPHDTPQPTRLYFAKFSAIRSTFERLLQYTMPLFPF